ncbi:hypothetical protein M218_23060 [Burkholderia pseudomallei MSHR338]|nr:hypothetical protein M218_23060 [Burkholderia pseudomallei MSHR338]
MPANLLDARVAGIDTAQIASDLKLLFLDSGGERIELSAQPRLLALERAQMRYDDVEVRATGRQFIQRERRGSGHQGVDPGGVAMYVVRFQLDLADFFFQHPVKRLQPGAPLGKLFTQYRIQPAAPLERSRKRHCAALTHH